MQEPKKRAVLLGSTAHFHPENQPPTIGIGHLLESAYSALRQLGFDVTYADDPREIESEDRVDLLLGLEGKFNKAIWMLRPSSTVLLSVNRVRSLRPEWLKTIAKHRRRRWVQVGHEENLYLMTFPELAAGAILQLGKHNLETELQLNQVFFSMSRTVEHAEVRQSKSSMPDRQRILFYFGSICIRKGLGYLQLELNSLLSRLRQFGELEVLVHGWSSNRLNNRIMQKLKNSGLLWSSSFLDSDSAEYRELFEKSVLAVFPSFEEGQQDAVTQAVVAGVPVLVSSKAGFTGILAGEEFDPFDEIELTNRIVDLVAAGEEHGFRLATSQLRQLSQLPSTTESILDGLRYILESGSGINPFAHYSPHVIRAKLALLWLKGFMHFPATNAAIFCSRAISVVQHYLLRR